MLVFIRIQQLRLRKKNKFGKVQANNSFYKHQALQGFDLLKTSCF